MGKKIFSWARYIPVYAKASTGLRFDQADLSQTTSTVRAQYKRIMALPIAIALSCPQLTAVQQAKVTVANVSGKDWPFGVTIENYTGPVTVRKSSDQRIAELILDLDQLSHNTSISVPQVAGSLPIMRNLLEQTFYILLRPAPPLSNTTDQLFLSYSPQTQSPEKQLPLALPPAPPAQAARQEIKSRPIPAGQISSPIMQPLHEQYIPEILVPVTPLPIGTQTTELEAVRTQF